jgi:hypothetical protein
METLRYRVCSLSDLELLSVAVLYVFPPQNNTYTPNRQTDMPKTKSGRSGKFKRSKEPVVPRQVEVLLKQKKKQTDPGVKKQETKQTQSFYLTREEEEKDKSTHLNLKEDRSMAYITARGAAILELERVGTNVKDELLQISKDDIADLQP